MSRQLRAGSMFSGTGGLDEGVNAVLGSTTAWHVEHYRPARRVLEHHYPGVPRYSDAAAVDWAEVPPVDVLVAGFPCQKLSLLGKREGLRPRGSTDRLFDEPPSGWDLVMRAARALRPALIVLENVSALLTAPAADGDARGTAWLAVLHDLADIGLDAEWVCADASAAGGSHQRRRIFAAAADPERFRRGAWRDRHQAGAPPRFRWDDAAGGAIDVDRATEPVWGRFLDAVARWERRVGRRAPHPVLNRERNPALWEWLMGLPAGWLTGAVGDPAEVIRLAGNGVVPQQAALALPVLLDRLSEPAMVAS